MCLQSFIINIPLCQSQFYALYERKLHILAKAISFYVNKGTFLKQHFRKRVIKKMRGGGVVV